MARRGPRRRYPKGSRVKTTMELSLDLDAALDILSGTSRSDYLERVLRQVPEIAAQIESQRVSGTSEKLVPNSP